MKTFSIIICTCNRADSLRKTLATLSSILPADTSNIEVVVVDNASTDHTSAVIEEYAKTRPNVIHIFEPTPGKSIALNHGIRKSTGEIMAFLDDDVLPQPGWFENITAPLVADQSDTVLGRVNLAPHLIRDWMLPLHRGRFAEILVPDGACGLVGANMAMSRAIFNKTTGYDPNLGGGGLGNQEDTLMFYQMVILGARFGHASNAIVEHHFDSSRLKRKAWLKSAEHWGRSCAYVTHHWFHTTVTLPRLQRLRKQIQLVIWRLRYRPNMDPESEGASPAEMALVQHIGYLDQYRIESRKPRIYKKEGCDLKQPKAGSN